MSCDHGTCACNDTPTTDSESQSQHLPTVAEEHPTDQASGCCGGHGRKDQTAARSGTGN